MVRKEILIFGVVCGIISYFSALAALGETSRITKLVMLGILVFAWGAMALGFIEGMVRDGGKSTFGFIGIFGLIGFACWDLVLAFFQDPVTKGLWLNAFLFGNLFLASIFVIFLPKPKRLSPAN